MILVTFFFLVKIVLVAKLPPNRLN